jgi:hypothetical protein
MIFAVLLFALAADRQELPHLEVKFDRHRSGTIVEVQNVALLLETKDKTRISVNLLKLTIVHRNGRDVELDALRVGDRVLIEVMPNPSDGLDAVMVRAQAPPKRKRTPTGTAPR